MRDIKIATSAAEFAKGGFFLESFILPLPRRLILLARVKFPFGHFSRFKPKREFWLKGNLKTGIYAKMEFTL